MQGFDPPRFVTDLVLYDLPRTAEMAWILVSRFDRLRRQTALEVHVLIPENMDHPMVVRGVEYVQAAVRGEAETGAG